MLRGCETNIKRRNSFLKYNYSLRKGSVAVNKNIKMSSFKSRENIQKKEGGPDRSVSDN